MPRFWLAMLALVALVTSSGCVAEASDDEAAVDSSEDALSSKQAAGRADAATEKLLAHFWRAGDFEAASPSDGKKAGYWIYAQAFDAVLDAVTRDHGGKLKPEIARLYEAQARRGFRRDFFDDETWMAIALVRAHDLTGERRYLDEAEKLARDIRDAGWVAGRGVWWDRAHTSRATASNFGPVILAAKLFARTHDAEWKRFAEQVYAHWYGAMVNPATHQVADHVTPGGKVLWWKFTYNEGLAIGASLALHRITHERRYIDHAHAFASFVLAHEVERTKFGDVLSDGDRCSGDCDAFKGIAFRYLAELYETDRSQGEVRAVLDASAKAIWQLAREPATTTFGERWAAHASGRTSLAADASATMALNLAVGVYE